MYIAWFHCVCCKILVQVYFGSYLKIYGLGASNLQEQYFKGRSWYNGDLNSKTVLCAVLLVLSWRVAY